MVCGPVNDVIATLPGREDAALLLVAHYDSVPAGPGVGDDLSGVATMLEIARALRAGPTPQASVIFLFSDGEEEGLLGASAFAHISPLA
ncbi:MAG: M20/M25/M40 family metallo-hydrolase, partial [Gammaproteobacteria bacterium]|nr:M20/M25/M40 family metallo-hydrolase [Gammaproteobacteria bacterium]